MVEKSVEVLTPEPDESALAERRYRGPATGTGTAGAERDFAEVLAGLVKAEQISVDSHFFEDLCANSLVMAQFCARVRKRGDLPSVSMKDIYQYPTIRSLVTALADEAPPPETCSAAEPAETVVPVSRRTYVLCGTAQTLIFLAYCFALGTITARGFEWVAKGSGLVHLYLRSLVFGSVAMLALCLFPIAAKWILVGRWKPQEFPVWGLAYLRFWTVKVLVNANPMRFYVGNPLYVLYLRALGARIGKGVTILSRTVPVCTDLLTIGSGTVIRKESYFIGYRAHAGRIQTGRVTIGRDAFVGEKTVLDIDTSMGDRSQLGHTSALQSGESIPDGEHWHGSPAERTDVDYVRVPAARCGTLRRTLFGLGTVVQLFALWVPLSIGGAYLLLTEIPALNQVLGPGATHITSATLYFDALILSAVLFFGSIVLGLVWLFTVPRLLSLTIKPGKVYPLYGLQYSLHRLIARMTNVKFFGWLFGDSSYIVHYLRFLGYDLSKVEQTGSNFGTHVQHESPYLTTVGSGTMVADGLSVMNAEFSGSSFRLSRAVIGPRSFLGNNIAYPPGGRTGENTLLATKVMIPLDGEVREEVGLLGAPCFNIPRTVERDTRFDHLRTGDEFRRNLAAKNRYNLRTMAFWLFVRWVHAFALTVFALATLDVYGVFGQLVIALYLAITLAFTGCYFTLSERFITRFRSLEPKLCSIYDPYFWWHERLWKVPEQYLNLFSGTPYKTLLWRMLGVRMGKRVFDDGAGLTERTLTTIGDFCTLNQASRIQCHSQEDGTFKSDHSVLGTGCTLGVNSLVHYGVTMGDHAQLAADAFLMKGEEMPAHARWVGNPAAEARGAAYRPVALNGSPRGQLAEPGRG
ncbi:Pls/PosA family non-ribosomal peptide synthetase [Streptomyces sp. NPDC019645]|uniref:Pls/PosA family non-ribosomal peptide synthetase n=1 Tax=Streptomyces sp. NPDC019645 TaxID=3154786 RepID=UPI0033C9D8E0